MHIPAVMMSLSRILTMDLLLQQTKANFPHWKPGIDVHHVTGYQHHYDQLLENELKIAEFNVCLFCV